MTRRPKIVIFLVRKVRGGWEAEAVDQSIFTQAETFPELQEAVVDAVACHYAKDKPAKRKARKKRGAS